MSDMERVIAEVRAAERQMSNDRLIRQALPCPFCDKSDLKLGEGPDSIACRLNPGELVYVVICRYCSARGPEERDPGEAVYRWNRRA